MGRSHCLYIDFSFIGGSLMEGIHMTIIHTSILIERGYLTLSYTTQDDDFTKKLTKKKIKEGELD